MRKGPFIAGIVVLGLSLVLVVVGLILNLETQTEKVPVGGIGLKNTALTPDGFSATWSKVASSVKVYLNVGTPTCNAPTGVVTSGTGLVGSLSATLNPGTNYNLFACNGNTFVVVTISYTITPGITTGDLLGGAGIVVAFLLISWGMKRPRSSDELLRPSGSEWSRGRDDNDVTRRPRRRYAGRFASRLGGDGRMRGAARPDPPVPLTHRSRAAPSAWGQAPFRVLTPAEQRQRPVEACSACGRVYTRGRYTQCPACGAPFSALGAERGPAPQSASGGSNGTATPPAASAPSLTPGPSPNRR